MPSSATTIRIAGVNGTYFTRLSAVGGFPYDFEVAALRSMESLTRLIGELSPNDVLVVDCSFFNPPSKVRNALKEIFTPNETRPAIFLKNCELAFLKDIEGLVRSCRLTPEEELRFGSDNSVIEKSYRQHVTNQTSANYLINPKKDRLEGVDKFKQALVIEDDYFRKITEDASGLTNLSQTGERLRSTPIRSSRFFDASSILGDPAKYIWVISRLTSDLQRLIKMVTARQKKGELNLKSMPRLIACTTNGVSIASGIQSLLTPGENTNDVKLDVIYKSGPTPRMVEEYHGGIREYDSDGQDWYVYIGDYTIAGTELRIVESYAYYHGVPLLGGLTLGSILYFLDPTDITTEVNKEYVVEGRFSVFPLVSLINLTSQFKADYSFP